MFGRALLMALFMVLRSQFVLTCPRQCKCSSREQAKGLSAKCDGRGLREIRISYDSLRNVSVLNLKSNEITTIPSKAFGVQRSLKKLYLSRNKIRSLKNGAFTGLFRLNKLEMSYNDLLTISGEPFKGLKFLKILDLSHNNLNFIEGTVFKGLKRLQKLILSYNKFIIVPEATLKPLQSLSFLNLEYNDLLCDCHIKWLLRLKKIKRGVSGTCQYPEPRKNTKLRDVNQKNMRCATLTLPYHEFKPDNDEVAIKGDSFTFTCGTTWIRVLKINWYKDNQQLIPQSTNQTRTVIDFKVDVKAARLVSTLKLKSLSSEDSGSYRCTVSSDKTFVSGEAALKVLPGGSKFCHSDLTKTSKGIFQWDNTDLGVVARLRCPAGVLRGFRSNIEGYAYRKCGRDGYWQEVEGSECAYIDKITQKLYNLKQFPANTTTALAICKELDIITENATAIKSDIDVSYVASILESVRPFMGASREVGKVVVRIISKMMDVDQHILSSAQLKSKACSSFVLVLDVLANSNVVGTSLISDNVGLTIVPVFPATFQGRTCDARLDKHGRLDSIRCNNPWKNPSLFSPEQLEVSIHIPKSVFAGQQQVIELKLKFMVYKNGKLFPHLINGTLVPNPRVFTSVVNFQLGQSSLSNLTEPIAIKYRNHEHSDKYQPVAVYWDLTKKGGIGLWMENKDCKITKKHNTSISHCERLADKNYFALLMSIEGSLPLLPVKQERGLELEVMVYVGAGLCSIPLLMTFITYAVFRKLRYNRDDAAMLMNLCLALLVSVVMFAVGIYHVNNTLMCRAVGVLLHYFVLCSLLWIGCGALCLCRMLRTAVTPEEFNPVLRYYMISWGIPLIICGITLAGNPDNYNVQNFCYLRRNPFLGACVGPACLVILIDIMLYIRLNNQIYNTYSIIELSTYTSALEEDDTARDEQLPEHVASKNELLHHLHEVLPEKSDIFLYQKGSILILVLIVVNFSMALLLIKYNEPRSLYLVLSSGYALGNVSLGTVVFVFHCLKKTNAKKIWIDYFNSCVRKKKNFLVDQEVVPNTDSKPNKPIIALTNGETPSDNGAASNAIPRIYGAPTDPIDSDIQSNVSLPSSAALTINDLPMNNGNNVPRVSQPKKPCSPSGSDKHSITTSMSDKQSCVSAPLPLSHIQPGNDQQPPRYSYCFADSANKKKKKKTRTRAPLALPDKNGISSSRESGIKVQKELQSMHHPSEKHQTIPERDAMESAASELSSVKEPASYLETPVPYSSCASSDVSVPVPVTLTSRPPIPGAPEVKNFAPGNVFPATGYSVVGAYESSAAYSRHVPHTGAKTCPANGGQTRTIGQSSNGDQTVVGDHSNAGGYPNHYPRAMYVPANLNYSRNPGYPAYPKTIPEERYVSMPKRSNGHLGNRQSESDHVYESIDEQQKEECPANAVAKTVLQNEQNGPENRPDNEATDSENTSLLGPPQGVQTSNGSNLPRRKPRQRYDKSRTRRYRDGAARRKEPSFRSGTTRLSATSLKSDRTKPEPKEWVPDTVPRMAYVPIPHLMEKKETRSETSV